MVGEIFDNWGEGKYLSGFFYRDGGAAPGCLTDRLPDWVPWDELVKIAESLSKNKDMFRVDMFVGVPRYSDEGAELQIVVSESEIHPTTMFCNPLIADEMARLWLAGYRQVYVMFDCKCKSGASIWLNYNSHKRGVMGNSVVLGKTF